ncbi:GntR family transcriptional regulator [Mesorhizobium sp. YIM 152430]|uniref:GntR family transcriptional regulator n=1 Tax=Mesorhizobium sp. YIM 152430 TaxID=3031761 RepID=UPI0023DB2336|nr:GntR family transcriptional regulator [Mesorhizobium sp. YIM 152430]MDF1599326.1 GntR family transcriptional regulator [Mesorhizobium sp. YIM 152430]
MALPVSNSDTAGENAYRRIRHDIIFGRLAPGSRLRLERLKEPYLASVSTLREILFRLSSEGLVVAEGQRGFEVAPVSQQNFREVAAMRDLLEGHALRESFRRGDVDWEGEVVAAHHKLARMERLMLAGEREDPAIWKRYDWEFHHALISACGSAALLAAHAQIFDRYLRYQIIAVIFRGESAMEEHRQLRQHALDRDADSAVNVLKSHIGACVAHTLEHGLLDA